MADFTSKTVLITGAGRGIGRAVALRLTGAGAAVILLARTTAQLNETRALLRERGVAARRISVVPADLSDEADRSRAAAVTLAAGRVDILVNNAAIVEPAWSAATPTPPPRPRSRHTPSNLAVERLTPGEPPMSCTVI